MPSQLERTAEEFRADLRRRERATVTAMVNAYGEIWRGLNEESRDIAESLAAMRDAGEVIDLAWVRRQERVRSLAQQARNEMQRFSRFTEARVTQEQARMITDGQEHAEQLMLRGFGRIPQGVDIAFDRLPAGALQEMIGTLADGSPLRDLLDELPGSAGRAIEDSLVQGLTQGENPRRIASRMRSALGGDLTRALRIARTEPLRAYRTSSLETYRANERLMEGWVWMAVADDRTCAACWMMHGTFHTLDESLDSHIMCRCSQLPRTKSWEALGYQGIADTRPQIESGRDQFLQRDAESQERILGPAKFRAWQSGEIDLDDLVGMKHDDQWGDSRYVRSLKEMLGPDKAAEFYRAA